MTLRGTKTSIQWSLVTDCLHLSTKLCCCWSLSCTCLLWLLSLRCSFELWFDIDSISEAENVVAAEREQNILSMLHQVSSQASTVIKKKTLIKAQVACFWWKPKWIIACLASRCTVAMPDLGFRKLQWHRSHKNPFSVLKLAQFNKWLLLLLQILTPFLLRRLKTDVALEVPPKKEIIVYAPLTTKQEALYTAVVNKTIAKMLGMEKVMLRITAPSMCVWSVWCCLCKNTWPDIWACRGIMENKLLNSNLWNFYLIEENSWKHWLPSVQWQKFAVSCLLSFI